MASLNMFGIICLSLFRADLSIGCSLGAFYDVCSLGASSATLGKEAFVYSPNPRQLDNALLVAIILR